MQRERSPNRPFRAALLCVATTIALALNGAAPAADYVLSSLPPSSLAPLRETAAMKLGANAAPWLPRIIDAIRVGRPSYFKPTIIALFRGQDTQRYLSVRWKHRLFNLDRMEFYKIVEPPNGSRRIRYLRTLSAWAVDLQPASGMAVFPGEPAMAVVYLAGGGSAIQNYELRLIQMKRNTVDITPDWAGRIVDVADIDGDGRYEVVAMNDRWTGFFNTAGSAGPFIPVVLDRIDGRFVPNCRKYAKPYRRWIKGDLQDLADPAGMAPHRAEDYASLLLAYAQIGAFADARRAFVEMMKIVADRQHMPGWIDPQKTRQKFAAVLAGAEKYAHAPCPVSAANATGGHPGAEAVIEHFRFAAPEK